MLKSNIIISNTEAAVIENSPFLKQNKKSTFRKSNRGSKNYTVKKIKGLYTKKTQSISLAKLKAITERRLTAEMAYAAKAFIPKHFDLPISDAVSEGNRMSSNSSSICTDSDNCSIDFPIKETDEDFDNLLSLSNNSRSITHNEEQYNLPLWTNPSSGQSIMFLSTAKNVPRWL